MSTEIKCLQFYQYVTLEKVFREENIPLGSVLHKMRGFIPSSESVTTQVELKDYIIKQGSCMYNKLIECLSTPPTNARNRGPFPALAAFLKSHNVKELYRYFWMHCEQGVNMVMVDGESWYTDYDTCRQRGLECKPKMEVFDGPGSPSCILFIESCCACNVLCQRSIPVPHMFTEEQTVVKIGCCCACCLS